MQTRHTPTNDAAGLANAWFERYYREALTPNGDPEALISNYRELSERALPQSPTHQAFALFLVRVREADMDLDPDDPNDGDDAV